MNAFKYWRVTKVVSRESIHVRTVAEINFLTRSKVVGNDPLKVGGSSVLTEANNNAKAFDGDATTYAKSPDTPSADTSEERGGLNWFISYEFDEPEVLLGVSVRMRPLTSSYTYEEWQKATVEASVDGVIWEEQGWLEFNIPSQQSALYTAALALPHKIDAPRILSTPPSLWKGVSSASINTPIPPLKVTETFFPFSSYESALNSGVGDGGYISGIIYERVGDTPKKVPVSRAVYLYRQDTGALVMRTWSNSQGEYLFNKLALGTTYMIVSVDHTGQWGLEGAAFKKAKRRDTSGLSL